MQQICHCEARSNPSPTCHCEERSNLFMICIDCFVVPPRKEKNNKPYNYLPSNLFTPIIVINSETTMKINKFKLTKHEK